MKFLSSFMGRQYCAL